MNALMSITSTALTMSSKEMSGLTEKRHDSVKRTIETLVEKGVISQPQIVDGPKAANGVVEKHYLVGKRDSYVIVAQLSPEFTARLVDRWQELEAQATPAAPAALSTMDILKLAMEAEQGRLLAIEQRDAAIRTKALIGSKREATAMATAAKATREVQRLTEELGRNARHATVIAVEKATGRKFGPQDWRPLRDFCKSNGLAAEKVTDPRWGEVKAWPSEAWCAVYEIDLSELFPEQQVGMH